MAPAIAGLRLRSRSDLRYVLVPHPPEKRQCPFIIFFSFTKRHPLLWECMRPCHFPARADRSSVSGLVRWRNVGYLPHVNEMRTFISPCQQGFDVVQFGRERCCRLASVEFMNTPTLCPLANSDTRNARVYMTPSLRRIVPCKRRIDTNRVGVVVLFSSVGDCYVRVTSV